MTDETVTDKTTIEKKPKAMNYIIVNGVAVITGLAAAYGANKYFMQPLTETVEAKERAAEISDLEQEIQEGKGSDLTHKAFTMVYGNDTLSHFGQNVDLTSELNAAKTKSYAEHHPVKHFVNDFSSFVGDTVVFVAVGLGTAKLLNKLTR